MSASVPVTIPSGQTTIPLTAMLGAQTQLGQSTGVHYVCGGQFLNIHYQPRVAGVWLGA